MNIPVFDSSDEDDYEPNFPQARLDNDDIDAHLSKNQSARLLTRGDLALTDKTLKVLMPHIYVKKKIDADEQEEKIVRLSKQAPLAVTMWIFPDGRHLVKMLHDTAEELKSITNSAGYILYVHDEITNEIYICSKSLTEMDGRRYSWKLKRSTTIAAYVAVEKKPIIVNDNTIDSRFPDGQDLGDFYASNILTVPVRGKGVCAAIIEFYRTNGVPYENNDLNTVTFVADLAGEVIVENRKIVLTRKNQEVNDRLLEETLKHLNYHVDESNIYTSQTPLLNYARHVLNSESVTYFNFTEDGDLERTITSSENPTFDLNAKKQKLRLKKEIQIANIVKESRSIVNFLDVFNDPRFDKAIDRHVGLLIRSVLACEIHKKNNERFGILMVINKLSEDKFTAIDEKIIDVLSKYLSIGLEFSQASFDYLVQKKSNASLEDVLFYQISKRAPVQEIYNLDENIYIPSDFHQFSFVPNDPNMEEIPKYLYYMLKDIHSELSTNKDALYTFIFAAKRIYRPNPFHNFYHAFKCAHLIYLILKNHPAEFDNTEKLAMLLAAVLHDADHRALSPQYLEMTNHPIINKSLSTPLEMHQYTIGRHIIEMTQLLSNINSDQLTIFYKIFKECILSTNLTTYLRQRVDLKVWLTTDTFNFSNQLHRSHLRTIMMTSADFSGEAKTPEYAMICARNLYTEYLAEGDLLKEINVMPTPIMNRDMVEELPKHEMVFVTTLAMPCYELLQMALPKTSVLYEQCKEILKMWTTLAASNGLIIKRDEDQDEETVTSIANGY